MRIRPSAFLALLLSSGFPVFAQQAVPTPGTTTAPAASAAAKADPVSPLVQTAIDSLQAALGSVKVEKWKGGSVRNEAAGNVASIQKDLQSTLPGLLSDADAGAGSVSKVLPLSRNLNALYDVVIRVWDGARIAAPAEQVEQLQQAMTSVDKARRALDDRLAMLAATNEKQVSDLRGAVTKMATAAATPPPPPPAPPCPAPAPKKKVVKKKPAAKPATPAPGSTTAPAPAKPNPQQ
jgi:hypothetical protein